MMQYKDLVTDILRNGVTKDDRTGVGTKSVFGRKLTFNLKFRYPLLTLKKTNFKAIAYELLWFLSGSTNTAFLEENGINIWNEWKDEKGELGPVYGKQWRSWSVGKDIVGGIDQIGGLIETIKNNPDSRRMLVSTWNVSELGRMALYPCHVMFQINITNNRLNMCMFQRSADVFIGLPFNIASYAMLAMMLADLTGYEYGNLTIFLGDAHIYNNHLDLSEEMLRRTNIDLPTLELTEGITSIDDYSFSDMTLHNYEPHPFMKAEIAV